MEHPKVTIRKYKEDGKWIVSVNGITNGAEIYFLDSDNGVIRFKFDASRFDPIIRVER